MFIVYTKISSSQMVIILKCITYLNFEQTTRCIYNIYCESIILVAIRI